MIQPLFFCSSEPKDSSRGVRTRRTDTNILAVKFNSLAEPGNFHTGDAEICSNKECEAIVSHLTTLKGEKDDMNKVHVHMYMYTCM